MTIGIAIPTYVKHIKFLERLLDSIEMSTVLPDQVVISASEIKEKLPVKNKYSFQITVLSTDDYKNPAENTNIALNWLDTDIMTVIGGDDMVHPQRNEFLIEAFENPDIYAIAHNFKYGDDIDNTFLNKKYDKLDLFIDHIDTVVPNKIYPISSKGEVDFANAFVAFRRVIFDMFKYDESESAIYTEDSLFNRTLIENDYKISYIKNKLALYIKNPDREP